MKKEMLIKYAMEMVGVEFLRDSNGNVDALKKFMRTQNFEMAVRTAMDALIQE